MYKNYFKRAIDFTIVLLALLVIWPIELTSCVENVKTDYESIVTIKNSGKTVFGLSIGFPKVEDSDNNKIKYKINKIAAMQLFDIDNDDVDFDEETGVEEK